MHMRWSDLIAIYAAIVSTYQALRWMFEVRPYYTFFQPEVRRPADSILVRVHNPGRKMIFIVDQKTKVIRSRGEEVTVKATPRGHPEKGITAEYAAYLMVGQLFLAIAPGSSADFSIGPVYPDMDLVFTLDWHRGGIFNRFWSSRLFRLINPLRVRVTPEIEKLITTGRTDF